MTTETETETEIEERKPLLDLDELTDRRDYITTGGKNYFLHTEGLSSLDHHRLVHATERHDHLFRIPPEAQTKAQSKELAERTDEMLAIVLEAPASIRKKIPGNKARELVRHFQQGSQSDAENLPGLLALLMGMAQTQAATDAIEGTETESSTTES